MFSSDLSIFTLIIIRYVVYTLCGLNASKSNVTTRFFHFKFFFFFMFWICVIKTIIFLMQISRRVQSVHHVCTRGLFLATCCGCVSICSCMSYVLYSINLTTPYHSRVVPSCIDIRITRIGLIIASNRRHIFNYDETKLTTSVVVTFFFL